MASDRERVKPDTSSIEARGGRDESAEERADRMWADILQEVRVAQTGLQILFGVLLIAVFQPVFAELGDTDRALYIAAVTLGAATAGPLIGPVSLHRTVTGRHIKPQTVALASHMTRVGLVMLATTTALTLLLLLRTATDDTIAWWLTAAITLWVVSVWFLLPIWARRHYPPNR
ncbi:DUF6328 family protein [Streptomyces sp. NBC_00513]|uniref:DUF6328 family protein n=1 Tax=unclassified Streptomyces TaxID=2593676 RepID=UPI002253C7F4|nr:DUF6328 family protein [Streptomyces sp. NBC_00424]MCX5079130.1 DUF6328 family protein [Streptomyces sp. NBC_00424]WUD39305.1 DUF6328 family protein [Streptomyces sp. NBC_00513]